MCFSMQTAAAGPTRRLSRDREQACWLGSCKRRLNAHCCQAGKPDVRERKMRIDARLAAILLILGLSRLAFGAESVVETGAKPQLLQETGAGEGPAWETQLGLLTSGNGHIMRRD